MKKKKKNLKIEEKGPTIQIEDAKVFPSKKTHGGEAWREGAKREGAAAKTKRRENKQGVGHFGLPK